MTKKIAIVGAGLAGLTLARALQGHAEVTMFDKSRGVGGRMASRRRLGFAFDHGAQYFTARSEAFRAVAEKALAAGTLGLWPQEIVTLPAGVAAASPRTPEPFYIGMPSMTGLAAAMAQGQDIRLETHVSALRRVDAKWQLVDDRAGSLGLFDLVVSTVPAPQAERLMPAAFSGCNVLQSVRMAGCFTLMIGGLQPPELDFHAARVDHPILSWVAVNNSKPGRDTPFSLVVHSRNDWAQIHIEDATEHVRRTMLSALEEVTGHNFAQASWIDLQRWRYASVDVAAGQPFLLDAENGLAACGDWCIGGRVEAAFESGNRLGEAMLSLLGAG